jgi:hypothetical protein
MGVVRNSLRHSSQKARRQCCLHCVLGYMGDHVYRQLEMSQFFERCSGQSALFIPTTRMGEIHFIVSFGGELRFSALSEIEQHTHSLTRLPKNPRFLASSSMAL